MEKNIKDYIFILSALLMFYNFPLLAQNDTTVLGGVVNKYSKVNSIDYTCNFVEVTNPSFFPIGSTVLLIQMQGAIINETNTNSFGNLIDLQNAGSYEMAKVKFVMNNRVYFTTPILRQYNINGAVQLIYVPDHENIRIATPVSASPWNGSLGGIVIIKSKNLMILNAEINATQRGFRAGRIGDFPSNSCFSTRYFASYSTVQDGEKGEGIAGWILGKETSRGKNLNGGGGGNYHNCGGGGGGNGGTGGIGGREWTGCNPPAISYGGIGGFPLASIDENQFFLGGGGGGGNSNDNQSSVGGIGGGLVILIFNELQSNNSSIKVNGQTPAQIARLDSSGGGGAGGTVVLYGNEITGSLNIESKGGDGGQVVHSAYNNMQQWGSGGGGGGGQILTNLPSLNSSTYSLGGGQFGRIPVNGSWGAANGFPGILRLNLNFPFLKIETTNEDTLISDSLFYCDNIPDFLLLPCHSYLLLNEQLEPIQTIMNNNKYYLDLPTEGIYHLFFLCLDDTCFGDFFYYKITYQIQSENHESLHLCYGDTVNYLGYQFEKAGQFLITVPRQPLCDSLILLDVIEHQNYEMNISGTICNGQSFAFFEEEIYDEGEYYKVFKTTYGCDSIYKLQLNKNPTDFEQFQYEICSGDSIFFNNQYFKETGIEVFSYLNEHGCDSIIEFNLQLIPISLTQLNQQSCLGTSFPFFDNILDSSGIYKHTLISQSTGCDSIIELKITFENTISNSFYHNICQGETVLFNGKNYNQTGNYKDTLIAYGGCDSILILDLIVYPTYSFLETIPICENKFYVFYEDTIVQNGIYSKMFESIDGCDSLISIEIKLNPTYKIEDFIQTDEPYKWNVNNIRYYESGEHYEHFLSIFGCDSIHTLDLLLIPNYAVFAPSAFTPDKNGINDKFTIFGTENIKEIEFLEIFDRWGNLIGRLNNLPANDANYGWDGTMNGQPLMPGVYIYNASVVFHSGYKVNLNGEITLIK